MFPTEGQRIEKARYELFHREQRCELDIFQGRLAGLMTVEVEFTSEIRGQHFNPPDWFGEEITYDACYKNKNLARHGLSMIEQP